MGRVKKNKRKPDKQLQKPKLKKNQKKTSSWFIETTEKRKKQKRQQKKVRVPKKLVHNSDSSLSEDEPPTRFNNKFVRQAKLNAPAFFSNSSSSSSSESDPEDLFADIKKVMKKTATKKIKVKVSHTPRPHNPVLRTSVSPQQENGGAGLQPNKRTHKKLRLTSDEVERMSLQDAPRETSDKNKRSKIKEVLVVNKKNIRKQSKENFDEIEAEIASGDEYVRNMIDMPITSQQIHSSNKKSNNRNKTVTSQDDTEEILEVDDRKNRSPKAVLPRFATFKIINETTVTIRLECETLLYVHGVVTASCIDGACEILGHTLVETPCPVYSLRGSSFLCFETMGCTLQLEACPAPEINFINEHIPQHIIPDMKGTTDMEKLLHCRFAQEHDGLVFQKSPQWDVLGAAIKDYETNSRTLICGGKAVGKSTMFRFLVNKLMLINCGVLCIDLDIGQSEFSIAGCVSAVLMREPLLGPNYTHLMTSETQNRSYFVGAVDVSKCTDIYIKSVRRLFNYCKTLPGDFPWVINTMGFVHGVGNSLTALFIHLFDVSHVIQINSNNPKFDFPRNLHPEAVKSINRNSAIFEGFRNYTLDYKLFLLNSMAKRPESQNSNDWTIRPRDARYMNVYGYMSKILKNPNEKLTDIRPYVIKLKDIKLKTLSTEILPELVPAMFNGSMVALCTNLDEKLNHCVGFGIVRGIDGEELYLITPLTKTELKHVTTLILSAEPLPPNILLLSDFNSRLIPYVSTSEKLHTTEAPRRVTFNHINKKKLWEQISHNAETKD